MTLYVFVRYGYQIKGINEGFKSEWPLDVYVKAFSRYRPKCGPGDPENHLSGTANLFIYAIPLTVFLPRFQGLLISPCRTFSFSST